MNDIPKAKALAFHRHRSSNNPSLKWLIKGLLPETGTGLLSGTSGAYKTFVAFDVSGAIASAPMFLGFKIKRPGATLIFASEGKANIVRGSMPYRSPNTTIDRCRSTSAPRQSVY
jgi:RecA-family ATPase